MNKVERLSPHEVPGRDMFYPSIISDPEGFYLGMELDGLTPGTMRACISVKGIKELARQEGMIDPAEAEDLVLRLQMSEAARAEAEREAELAAAELESFAGLRRTGWQIQKKTGRPPKVKEAA